MTRIQLRKYQTDDWFRIADSVEPFVPPEPIEEFLKSTKHGISVTGVEDGVVMACGGIFYADDNKGIAWLKVSKKCTGFSWARTIKETFALMKKVAGDLEIYTYILDNFCSGEKTARMIGLKKANEIKLYNNKIYTKYTMVT